MKKLQQVKNQLQVIYTTKDSSTFVNTVEEVTKQIQDICNRKTLTKEEKDYIWDIYYNTLQKMFEFKFRENNKKEEEYKTMCALNWYTKTILEKK